MRHFYFAEQATFQLVDNKNVHPPLGDPRRIVQRSGVTCFVLLFCAAPDDYLRTDFGALPMLTAGERMML